MTKPTKKEIEEAVEAFKNLLEKATFDIPLSVFNERNAKLISAAQETMKGRE
jgi:hypothetical protein